MDFLAQTHLAILAIDEAAFTLLAEDLALEPVELSFRVSISLLSEPTRSTTCRGLKAAA
jgi:hypothetical protein